MEKKAFDFIGKKNLWFILSISIIVIAFSVIGFRYIAYKQFFTLGIDFTGGSSIVLRFDALDKISQITNPDKKNQEKDKFLNNVRSILGEFQLEQSSVQYSEGKDMRSEDLMIKTKPLDNEVRQGLLNTLETKLGRMELLESDIIGPSIGAELASTSVKIIFIAVVLLLIYITFRFDFPYAIAAIVALLHDTLLTIGLAGMFKFEIDTAFVAAILTILGYSIHDTIVIFDRIRENVPLLKSKETFFNIVNISISQTLARSINTVLTVELTLLSLLVFGGETIKTFSLVLLLGVFFGAYSSIFIAGPILVMIKKWQEVE
ncbi:MAG: protein translocase subunit SecF [Candidatus Margulisiibacteriota bacterium]|nr:MAG: protein translocase subunit SecF [Candidatus Margulisiibacteriota bacterium]HAR62956.1 protein translocase subunit SecF [Candidatus Margulisiibacteriota bacterium]HCT83968.1 protein translocase subunit SecF [Candidatus Margulisiibacteriota bacterium]HCY37007.1 protein translocase subunit SecF [Candidatus Margulisiibacteriota bacterium]